MKKLVYVAPVRTEFPSTNASSLHMVKMCEAYTKLGYDVTLVVGNNKFEVDEILDFYNVNHKFKIKSIFVSDSKVGNITYAIKSYSLIKQLNPDYLVGRSVTTLSLAALLGLKVTIDMHAPIGEMHVIDQYLLRIALKSKNLIKITTNSNALKNIMVQEERVPEDRIAVAHNGSDEIEDYDFTGYNQELCGEKDSLKVGYFGSLYEGRGIELIIELAKKNKSSFHVFGGAQDDINKWRAKLTSISNIYFYGHVSYKDTFYFRSKCDVLIAPYNPRKVTVSEDNKGDSSRYMNPIKLIEYLSAGRPVLASDVTVLKEVLTQDCAFFCDYNNLSEWISALEQLENTNLLKEMSAHSLNKFKQGYTWVARAKKLI